ncbi:hypothetical protein P4O66_009510, partial [Electrophorus voltai]
MSKTLKRKKHWSTKVQECAVSWGGGGEFGAVVEVLGGAEHGEFPFLGQMNLDVLACHVGRLPYYGDVLLEVNGTPVSGLTNRDTHAVIRHFREPIRIKTVKPAPSSARAGIRAYNEEPGDGRRVPLQCQSLAIRGPVSLVAETPSLNLQSELQSLCSSDDVSSVVTFYLARVLMGAEQDAQDYPCVQSRVPNAVSYSHGVSSAQFGYTDPWCPQHPALSPKHSHTRAHHPLNVLPLVCFPSVKAGLAIYSVCGDHRAGLACADYDIVMNESQGEKGSEKAEVEPAWKVLNTDLRHYLGLQFQKGSLDHKLQQVIRDNLYLRTIPCTTRLPREGEVPGVDYNFISVSDFRILEESGLLLESGTYDGNYYGTPKPPAEPNVVQPDLVDQVLFEEEFGTEVQRKRTTSVSKMDRKDSVVPEEEDEEERPALPNGFPEGGEEWGKPVPSYNQRSNSSSSVVRGGGGGGGSGGVVGGELRTWSSLPRDDSLEPLPFNWEMAYTETGMVYFIDHNSKSTTWLDPRLAKKAKPPEKCEDGELPYGWEEIEDPQYGTYYVDHINQRTQFENPVLEAKRKLAEESAAAAQSQKGAAPAPGAEGVSLGFTRDPTQLKGELYHTALRKGVQGFGFTIIGGDRPDEFLQVKNVLADGPAAQDNKMTSGDVIVEINGMLVLGNTHAEVVHMFQCIPVNQYVDMVLCRGYTLPVDVDTDGEELPPPPLPPPPPVVQGEVAHGSPRATRYGTPEEAGPAEGGMLQPELVSVPLVKGPGGFGFAIADCPLGQKVKMILDAQWCRGLLKGDVIKEVNRCNVQALSHAQVVDLLKELPVGSEVNLLVLRGGHTSPVKSLRPRQEMSTSLETLERCHDAGVPQALTYYSSTLPCSSPRRDHAPRQPKAKTTVNNTCESCSMALLNCFAAVAQYKELDVFIKRDQETGFGFRVLGGERPEQPVYIGAVIRQGAAEKDGRLRAGDELMAIDGITVKGKSHKQVLDLMTNAARNGQVLLSVRRKVVFREVTDDPGLQTTVAPVLVNGSPRIRHGQPLIGLDHESFDITLHRKDNEGFGFVILTSKSKPPPGVIPHKIGRIIEGSPADRCGLLSVGDRISAVNGHSIIQLSHNDIVQLIKEAGSAVTLSVVPEDEYKGPPSGASSAKQSPALQHRILKSATQEESNKLAELCYVCYPQGCILVELERSPRGFGFSLRGGTEYNMGLYILRLAEDGPAFLDGRIQVGDQIVEINGEPTQGISHTRAIELIQAGGNKVLLLLRPGQGLVSDN